MKKFYRLTVLALCLLLTACVTPNNGPGPDTPDNTPNQPDPPVVTDPVSPSGPVVLGSLAVEIVVEPEDADRLLSQLDQLSRLLGDALREQEYIADDVKVTLSTAGGFTGSALAAGGVDIACMPAVDYVVYEAGAAAVLTTDEDLCTAVVAVSGSREELGEAFHAALAKALLESESGAQFLETCCPGAVYVPAEEAAIQAVRDWVAEQEESSHGA